MLIIENISKHYRGAPKASLHPLTLRIDNGVYGLLGPNGAGKSTLLSILAGIISPDAGEVRLDGVGTLRSDRRRWRGSVGYLPQDFDFPAGTSGRNVVREAAALSGLTGASVEARIDDLLERANLTEFAAREAAGYSRGMKQRLGFVVALIHDPPLLLLDEPTAGLDPRERATFRDIMIAEGSHRILLVSTHIVADLTRTCRALGVLHQGKLLFDGSPEALAAQAQGRVREQLVDAARWEEEFAGRAVASAVKEGSGLRIRWVGPRNGEDLLVPTLEEGYLAVLGTYLQEK